ncbi:restriction endonuclease [Propionimicrobium sp. PCR01-08-3]|uniref:restriction endonuclease n=1 Tax=Propionimicrobium sp. PCR01-08-3 TaxID=3052086 RepID=UPI00255C694A|nr:restriction endonuclease [Propionimicrobium sp. PCR01-08-3]WIY83527.1 restriction endonuclease [Propionimicrobium sp. PCR01-08-3]
MSETSTNPGFLEDWEAAEVAAAVHMRSFGFIDAATTSGGADGGIDAQSSQAAAQVKFHANPVGRPDVQRMRGACHDYRIPLFYSTGGYTGEAVGYADQSGVALFKMDPYGRCSPVSRRAVLLADADQEEGRKAELAEIQALRYSLAAMLFDEDTALFARYAQSTRISPDLWVYYSYMAIELERSVRDFHTAINFKDFERADIFFEEIENRIKFLTWIVEGTLLKKHADLASAISEGWYADATPGSDFLLGRAVIGVRELRDFLRDKFSGLEGALPPDISLDMLIDEKTMTAIGMLAEVALDPAILPQELLRRLKVEARQGVARGHDAAHRITKYLTQPQRASHLNNPNVLISTMLRTDCLVTRIYRQLDASDL